MSVSQIKEIRDLIAKIKKEEQNYIEKHGHMPQYYLDPNCGITEEQLEEIASGKFLERLPELLEKKND